MTSVYPLKFRPIPQKRIWGGHRLKSWFGVTDEAAPIGEYWVLSAHPNATSVVVNGDFAGRTLTDIVQAYPEAYLGRSPQPRFPLLIKFLEAREDLSVQVHPDDTYAQQHEGDFGKTEAWYVLETENDGKVVFGHRFPDKDSYRNAVAEGLVKEYLRYEPVQPGQVVFVPARTLHALLAGTVVIEVQQTSDVTYRVYDWDRKGPDGKGRELHIDKAADVLAYGSEQPQSAIVQPTVLEDGEGVRRERLVTCPYFTLEKLMLKDGKRSLNSAKPDTPDILIMVKGSGVLRWEGGELSVERGDTVLIPTSIQTYHLDVPAQAEVLRVTY